LSDYLWIELLKGASSIKQPILNIIESLSLPQPRVSQINELLSNEQQESASLAVNDSGTGDADIPKAKKTRKK
jgi:hypothetical protein